MEICYALQSKERVFDEDERLKRSEGMMMQYMGDAKDENKPGNTSKNLMNGIRPPE
jgi:hypothetical protein